MRQTNFPIQAIIFDFDGVVLDSHRLMRRALQVSYRVHVGSGSPPFNSFFSLMGKPLEEIFGILRFPKEMADTYRCISRELIRMIRPFDGVTEMLSSTLEQGIKLGLFTGKDRLRTSEILEHLGLRSVFSVVVCGDDMFPSKPNPAGLLAALSRLSVEPNNAAMLGDSPIDIACARAARVIPLAAGWGVTKPTQLTMAGAVRTFSCPKDFTSWIRRAEQQH